MFVVLYFDRNSNSPCELHEYCVEAYDAYDAERQFKVFARGENFDIYNIQPEEDPEAFTFEEAVEDI